MRTRRLPITKIADEQVPFPVACAWVGAGFGSTRSAGVKARCPLGSRHSDGGAERALRIYPDHGYCFSCQRPFTTSSLLAAAWEMSRPDAAMAALDRIGYVPVGWAGRWEHAQRDPDPGREHLAEALRLWLERSDPDWGDRQYDKAVAGKLARCLGLLPRVRTQEDCLRWMDACQQAMRRVIPSLPE